MDVFESSNQFLKMNRRSFLVLSGLLGIGAASATYGLSASSETVKFDKKRHKISKSLSKIGTFVSVTLIHSSKDKAEEAIGRAFDEIDRLERMFNRYDQNTAVAYLNRNGHIRQMPPEMQEIIAKSIDYHKLSAGSFDITVKPVVDLFQKTLGRDKKNIPTEKEIRNVLRLVGSDKIDLTRRAVHFKETGMGITLDGIAKGYIVDKASEILAANGIKDHLINAGGDIRTMGEKPNKRPWTVAIQDPAKAENFPDIIHMKDAAIATSGNYEIYYDQEKMFHHIVIPKTGLSPILNTSVSIVANSTMEADALSTGVFVMDPEIGLRFINAAPQCECLIVTRDNAKLSSVGWKSAAA